MEGGWLDELLMYRGLSFGFLKGLYAQLVKLNAKLRMFVRVWLVSTVILRPKSSNVLNSSFLTLSQSLPDLVFTTERSSLRYSLTFSPNRSFECLRINIDQLTRILLHRRSYPCPMVTSKVLLVFRFDHT